MPYNAHHLPADPDQANFDREFQRALEYAQEHQDKEEEADPDIEVNTDEYEDLAAPTQPSKDNLDPFLISDDLSAEDVMDLTHLPAQFLPQDPEYMDDIDPQTDDLKFFLHPEDSSNFLKLSAALHILIKHQLSYEDLDEVDQLIHGYCTKLLNLYGSNIIKPNHHYVTHVIEYAQNFRPLHKF
ncbi:hypothetical protein BDR06DRAFT_1004753 [Suillus hirtellus]|nr:hypothetical protein BDR06DRAFT_1004753 [Suillus hirtellus]